MAAPVQPFASEHLQRIPLYVPGKPIQEVQRELGLERIIKLASNENPWGPTEAVKQRVLAAVSGSEDEALGLYPVSDGYYLRRAIAHRRGLGIDQVLLGNGSSEILEMVAKATLLDGGTALIPRHSFAIYAIATLGVGGQVVETPADTERVDVDALLAAVRPDTRIVYLGNPNNPTGVLVGARDLDRLVRGLREDIVLVVDQAYAEYEEPDRYPDAARHLADRPSLLVLHTFSKIHALAGLRIGYGLGGPHLLQMLERVRSPFNTNHLAQVAAEVAVQDQPFEAQCRARNREARSAFQQEAARHRCKATGEAGNFILLESAQPAQDLYQALLAQGVIVRPMQGYGLPNHVRVTFGRPEEMAAFWQAAGPILDCGC